MGWTGDTAVEAYDGTVYRMQNLKKGLVLKGRSGPVVVECLVKTVLDSEAYNAANCDPLCQVVEFAFDRNSGKNDETQEIKVSTQPHACGHMYNPVMVISKWAKNSWIWTQMQTVSNQPFVNKYLVTYDIVLKEHHRHIPISVFRDVYIPSLGHGIVDDVICHPYFGSTQIIKDIQVEPAYHSEGLVVLQGKHYVRDDETGTVQSVVGKNATAPCVLA
ncbi:hypothetical protein CYMTET_55215 [Cymbomonas tetramitiformis]|uniref:Vint domain-containing protein n=1 Tax=Cymbomonas tetramitiformis TaxID=36881 RepID=A0AAE0BF00_9CHLO|nr:hypothetical protein CYMTET_55215 [Cymbomonas tetramitiformis]|eukprot:gene82-117_t